MKSQISAFSIFLIFLFIVSCQDDEPTSGNPTAPSFTTYPIEIGNTWNYNRIMKHINYDSLPANIPDSIFYTIGLEVTQEVKLHDSIDTYEFKEYIEEDDITSYLYSNNTNDGLISYAYMGGGGLTFPFKKKYNFTYRDLKFNSLNELLSLFNDNYAIKDSLFYEEPPVYFLKYPLHIGQQWFFKSVSDIGVLDKIVLNKQEVNVPAGSFDCYKIQRRWYFDNDSVWDSDLLLYDYIAKEGLIKREFLMFNIVVNDVEGNVLGTTDVTDISELVSYQID